MTQKMENEKNPCEMKDNDILLDKLQKNIMIITI